MKINSSNPAFYSLRPPVDQAVDPRQSERAQFSQACTVLQQHFGQTAGFSIFGSGTIDMNELYAAAHGKGGPEVQGAASFLLSHPQLLEHLETTGGRSNPDGKISLK